MTAIPHFYRVAGYYSFGMGLYGASRGYRSDYEYHRHEKKWVKVNRLCGYRLLDTVVNGLFYMWPPFSLMGPFHLVNRIQIRQMGWKLEDFSQEYHEFGSQMYCLDTF